MYIKNEKGYLKIYNDDEDIVYTINSSSIDETITEGDTEVSKWVYQLKLKKWAEKYMLYELAAKIQQLKPNNKIDWVSTFFNIEMAEYLEEKQYTTESSPKSLFDRTLERIEDNRSHYDDVIDENVTLLVTQKLKNFDIL